MPATKKLISTVTLGAGGASFISFLNIPQIYTDLILTISARIGTTTGSVWGDSALQFNSSGSGYSGRFLYGTGNNGAGSAVEGTSSYNIIRIQSNDGTAGVFSNTVITIPNYTSSVSKTISHDSVTENNGGSSIQTIHAGLWNNSAAITSLGISTSMLLENSTASLYGIIKGGSGSVDIVRYDFNSGVEGWTANNANLSASGGILTQAVTNNDAHMMSPSLSFSGTVGRYVKVVVKAVNAGQAVGWDGSVFYATTSHGYSESYKGLMTQPTWDGTYKTITLDMWNPHAGGSDWQNSTITSIRLDFGNSFTDGNFLIDSISISPNP